MSELESGPASQAGLTVPPAADDLKRAILQRRDKELRDAALIKLRAQLVPDSSEADKAGALATLAAVLSAKFDRQPFRPLVTPLLKSDSERLRMLAVACLGGLEADAADVEAIAPLAGDPSPEVRKMVARTLMLGADGRQSEIVAPALVKLLSDDDPAVIEQSLHSIWGQYSSPDLDARLIALSNMPKYHHNAIYFGLSTMRVKSKAVCERLVAELDDPDPNNTWRSAWGLSYGVADELKPAIETGVLRALPEATELNTRKELFHALGNVASDASREYLLHVVNSSTETDTDKAAARQILGRLQK